MNMPAEEEGCIATKCDCSNERFPIRNKKEFGQTQLKNLSHNLVKDLSTYYLKEEGQCKCGLGRYIGQDRERGIADQAASHTVDRILIDR